MIKINEILKTYNLTAKRIEKIGKITIIDDGEKKYVYKESKLDDKILKYLKSRNFEYMPNIISNNPYQMMTYIKGLNIPKEQKIIDLIKLTALLHIKTTHYKEIDLDYYEQIYDDIEGNIRYLHSYYTDIITLIESKVFPSPSEQMLERNISKIYDLLYLNQKKLDHWYALIKNKTKERKAIVHGNLRLDHFIRNKNSFLISWDKAKIDSPIFDLYKLYQNHALDFDFKPIIKIYEETYPLTQDEKELLYILISMPSIIKFEEKEYENCRIVTHELDKIYKTEKLILPEAPKQREKQ